MGNSVKHDESALFANFKINLQNKKCHVFFLNYNLLLLTMYNGPSQCANYAQKMQDAQVTKSLPS